MELDLGPEIAEYRAGLRSWIDEHAPAGLADKVDWTRSIVTGGYSASKRMEAMASPEYKQWEAACLEDRLICPGWPAEYGGGGLDAVRISVLNEELHRAGLPRVTRGMGESLVGPSVIVHGTAEQQAAFL